VRDRLDELGDATVAAITFAPQTALAEHRAHLELPFPLLADPDRDVYRRFDLGRGSLRDIWGLGTLRLYVQLVRSGRRLRRPTQDTRQLGGDFVIGRAGRLATGFWPSSPDDRPDVDALVAAVRCAD
jgi:hypothetical protein